MTSILKKLREFGRSTCTLPFRATILIRLENRARVITAARSLKFPRTLPVNISGATDFMARPICRIKVHGDVEPVDQRNVVKVLVTKLV